MKRCPKCNRAETDESLAFCRSDGTRLVGGDFVNESAGTLVLGSPPTVGDADAHNRPHAGNSTDEVLSGAAPTTVLDRHRADSGTQGLGYTSPYFVAVIYAGLGEKEQAFAWLEKVYEERHPYLVLLKVEPVFDKIRSDLRFPALMRRVGIPQ